jgi:hypothetical protein
MDMAPSYLVPSPLRGMKKKNIFMRSSALNEDTDTKQEFKTLAYIYISSTWTADLHFFPVYLIRT